MAVDAAPDQSAAGVFQLYSVVAVVAIDAVYVPVEASQTVVGPVTVGVPNAGRTVKVT